MAPSSRLPGLEVRDFASRNEREVIELLQSCLPGWRRPEARDLFRWKHLASPFGPSRVHLAFADGRLIGVGARVHWVLRFDGRQYLAGRQGDVAVHPAYRRRGVGTALASRDVQTAQDDGLDLHFHHGNDDSEQLVRSTGRAPGGRPTMHLAPLRPIRLLGWWLRKSSRPPDCSGLMPMADVLDDRRAVSDLLERAEPRGRLVTARSLDYLRWRYSEFPGRSYVATYLRDARGRLRGMLVGRCVDQVGDETLGYFEVSEVIADECDGTGLSKLLRRAWQVNAPYAAAVLPPAALQRRWQPLLAGFPIARQRGLNFGAQALAEDIPVDLSDLRNWMLPLGDLEAF